MRKLRVLVFGLDAPDTPVDSLWELLQSERDHLELRCERAKSSATREAGHQFCDTFLNYSPHLTFLCVASQWRSGAPVFFTVPSSVIKPSPIIAVLDTVEPSHVEEILRHGAHDVLVPPLRPVDVLPHVARCISNQSARSVERRRLNQELDSLKIIGESPTWTALTEKLPRIARSSASVLIQGETGTGKELFARAVHALSPRAHHPFIPVNCGALPLELIENELFGHEAGAFTSATAPARGLISEADGGTLFLDEIDSLPLVAQVKLLRFLQEKEFKPLGSKKTLKANVRVLAATNADLQERVRAGRLRQDLLYRLNVVTLNLPALRSRRGDIPLLARYFLQRSAQEANEPVRELSPDAMTQLESYHWPGNVRELENAIARAVASSIHTTLLIEDFDLPATRQQTGSFQALKARVIAEFEQKYIREALAQYGTIAEAARAAGKNRRAFWELMRKHRIASSSQQSS